jgi:hypothetical protein
VGEESDATPTVSATGFRFFCLDFGGLDGRGGAALGSWRSVERASCASHNSVPEPTAT